jgi:hypothetical protein
MRRFWGWTKKELIDIFGGKQNETVENLTSIRFRCMHTVMFCLNCESLIPMRYLGIFNFWFLVSGKKFEDKSITETFGYFERELLLNFILFLIHVNFSKFYLIES